MAPRRNRRASTTAPRRNPRRACRGASAEEVPATAAVAPAAAAVAPPAQPQLQQSPGRSSLIALVGRSALGLAMASLPGVASAMPLPGSLPTASADPVAREGHSDAPPSATTATPWVQTAIQAGSLAASVVGLSRGTQSAAASGSVEETVRLRGAITRFLYLTVRTADQSVLEIDGAVTRRIVPASLRDDSLGFLEELQYLAGECKVIAGLSNTAEVLVAARELRKASERLQTAISQLEAFERARCAEDGGGEGE